MTCTTQPRRVRAGSSHLGRGRSRGRVGIRRRRALLLLGAALLACASPDRPYEAPDPYYLERFEPVPDPGPQLEQGRPIPILDGLNHYLLSLPTKLILWNWQALDHHLPDDSRELLERYLSTNGLVHVKVRHNQYAPFAELRRLYRNGNVGGGYRCTLGVLNWLFYTLLPGRLLAGLPLIGIGDHFNPFSNTIHLYSSDATILLHEGGHAKDYMPHARRGSAFVLPRLIPGVDLIQEATASSDAIHFLQSEQERQTEFRAYRTLYPAYATYIAGYLPGGIFAYGPVVISGHVVGRIQASMRASEIADEEYRESLPATGAPKTDDAVPPSP